MADNRTSVESGRHETSTPCVECEDGWCEIHAGCDYRCGALQNPVTPEEVHASFVHYKSHTYLHGCSHGN